MKHLLFKISIFLLGLFSIIKTYSLETNNNYSFKEISNLCNSLVKSKIKNNKFATDKIAKIKNCSATKLYYGIDDAIHYKKARMCALKQKSYEILSMLYVNGYGVKRDNDLAILYACLGVNSKKVNIEFLNLLIEYTKINENSLPFNGCNSYSEPNSSICLSHELHRLKSHSLSIQSNNTTPISSSQWDDLMLVIDKERNYFESRAYFEIYNDNIKTIKYMIIEEMKLLLESRKLLDQIHRCNNSFYTKEDYKKLDDKLNVIFRKLRAYKVVKNLNANQIKTKFKDILQTELAWIKYKEALTSYGYKYCPHIPKENWSSIVTKQRIEQLENLLTTF